MVLDIEDGVGNCEQHLYFYFIAKTYLFETYVLFSPPPREIYDYFFSVWTRSKISST